MARVSRDSSAGDAEHPLAVRVGVAGGCPGVQGLGFRVWRTEEQGAEHSLAYPADLELRGMAEKADPRPHRDAGAAQIGVGYLQGDGGHVTAGEDIAWRGREDAGVVLACCEPLEESGQGDPVGGEGIRGQSRPCQPEGKISPVRPSPSSVPSCPAVRRLRWRAGRASAGFLRCPAR
jgi:hypothetical protein